MLCRVSAAFGRGVHAAEQTVRPTGVHLPFNLATIQRMIAEIVQSSEPKEALAPLLETKVWR